MAQSAVSYLVSTAGHSQAHNDLYPHDVTNLIQLIEDGAKEMRGEKVVGFLDLVEDGEDKDTQESGADGDGDKQGHARKSWVCIRYSYDELLTLSSQLAALLIPSIPISPPTPTLNPPSDAEKLSDGSVMSTNPMISLLCPTGLDFLIAWIGLMRMGYGVVFIAPQCSASAVAHLVKSTSSKHLVYHPMYTSLVETAHKLDNTFEPNPLPSIMSMRSAVALAPESLVPAAQVKESDVSHIFHTSGTSGVPKPIPQQHGPTVLALPRRALPCYLSNLDSRSSGEPQAEPAAFTTTPLFHGGVSDLLRAWMARSVVYFYPTSHVPITVGNVVAAIKACSAPPPPFTSTGGGQDLFSVSHEETKPFRFQRFQPRSFLSVPYILSVLVEDLNGEGTNMLKGMDYVSTGGAPLSTEVGDGMVRRGVRLVSRLGSSECGFLLSSHRDYSTEFDWEWLRNDSAYADALVYEQTEDDGTSGERKYEMIVTDRWKSKTKSNRPDGSYATGDLYIRHPNKADVWKYAGKGDDVLVLSNGEKASPGPIETILSTSPLLSDALIVGSDKDRFGVLLFSRTLPPPSDLLESLGPLIKQANESSPVYSQISADMCLVIDDSEKIKSLPKSSKGTVQRGLAYELFAKEIESLYSSGTGTSACNPKRSLREIEMYLTELIVESAGSGKTPLQKTTDLFSWGIDSVKSAVIRTAMQNNLNTGSQALPRNVVFEHPSITRLSALMYDLQEGKNTEAAEDKDAVQHELMRDMVEQYARFDGPSTVQNGTNAITSGKTILLTGVTGSLGAHLVHQISRLPVDVVNKIICLVRADDNASAARRVKDALAQRGLSNGRPVVMEAYAADLGTEGLGLKKDVYAELVSQVDVVLHAAWPVHFESNLVSFEDNIRGTRHLLDLIASSSRRAHLHFCSSLASVLGRPPSDTPIHEQPSDDPATASPIGYSRSKWVTEGICRKANEISLNGRVHVLRVGQLCGDTGRWGGNGHWNEKEGWPLLLRTGEAVGCLPMLDENPSWLPVDVAAGTIIDIAVRGQPYPLIYHVVHPEQVKWNTILDGLSSAGIAFDRVSPEEWLKRLDANEGKEEEARGSGGMLGMWRAAYGASAPKSSNPIISCKYALAASKDLREIEPVGGEQIKRMVDAWRKTGFFR